MIRRRTARARRAMLTLASLIAVIGCGGAKESSGGEVERGGGGEGGGGRRAPVVEVVPVAPRTVTETREVTGTLAPAREARLLAQLEGAVVRVLAEEASAVREGQVIAEFDATVQLAELTAARSRLRTAQAAAARAARLLALGAASRGEQEEAATALREAQGQLRAAEARAAYGAVRSPFDGVVTALRVDAGDVVGARQEIAVVADLRELRAVVPVSELDVVRLRDGAPVRAAVDAVPGRDIAARVRRVFPTVDPVTRQGVVEVEVPRSDPSLRPGLLARLTFTIAEVPNAIAVPLDAVRRDVRDRPYVYVVQDVLVHDSTGNADGEAHGERRGASEGASRSGASRGGRSEGGDPKGGESEAAGGDEGGQRGGDAQNGARGGPRRAQIVLRRPVRIGLRGSDNWVQLLEGVRVGDRVVVSGEQELGDSTEVRVARPGRGGTRGDGAGAQGAGGAGAGGGSSARAGSGSVDASGAPASAEGGAASAEGGASTPAGGGATAAGGSGQPSSQASVGGEAAANARGTGGGSGARSGAGTSPASGSAAPRAAGGGRAAGRAGSAAVGGARVTAP